MGEGDFGLITLPEASIYENLLAPFVFVSESGKQGPTRRNPTYRRSASRRNQINTTVCMSGYRSGTRCGTVIDLGEFNEGAGSLAEVGLVSGRGDNGCRVFIAGATVAEQNLNVDILPE